MTEDSQNKLLKQALGYHSRGWCIIPVPHDKKAARIKWKKYQKARPDEGQLRKWFGNGQQNIAVVLGPVSGALNNRDFDTDGGYHSWAEAFPELAEKLPTVKTANGYHVYFQASFEGRKDIKGENGEHLGELRGSGHYCMLPPSIHPDGPEYRWKIPVIENNLLVLDPVKAGLLPKGQNVTEQTEANRANRSNRGGGKGKREKVKDVGKAIELTLPRSIGTRNRCIFDFARTLKTMPSFCDADPKQLRELVWEWYNRALPKIATKDFEETWIDFLIAWPRIKHKIGEGPMAEIYEKTIQLDPPEIAVEKYPKHDKLKTLVSLCQELQRAAGDNPFFLTTRTAARLLKVTPMTISRWLFLLETDDILKVIAKGGTAKAPRKATRFRYIAV